MIHKNVTTGKHAIIQDNVFIGIPSRPFITKPETSWPATTIGENAVIRSGSIIYCAVTIGNDFKTGHNVMIREDTVINDDVLIGTNSVIDGSTKIGSHVSIQSMVYIPTNSVIEDNVFIGARAIVLKGVKIRKGSVVGAGCVVLKDVPQYTIVAGNPAKIVCNVEQ